MEKESIFPRDILTNMVRWTERREAFAIKGPRQSGKTTLLRILEDSLEKKGVRTVFLNFEDPDILESFETTRLKIEQLVFEEQVKLMDRAQIIQMYDKILAGEEEVFDPPVYFEWNTYRALVAIDNANVLPNFVMDEDHQPVSHAAGNRPDLIAEFDDFIVVTEVTLQTGKRQYMVEREPVVDHVGCIQKEERSKPTPRNVFGLFIAPKIVPNTVNYFYISAQTDTEEYEGPVLVIPIELNEFIDMVEFSGQVEKLKQDEIKQLMLRFLKAFESAKKPSDWRRLIVNNIMEWKKAIVLDRKKKKN